MRKILYFQVEKFSLDPDFGLACCKKCHYKYGHRDECSPIQLAQMICL